MSPELAQRLRTVDSAAIGARIRAARHARGLTQSDLAGCARVSTTYVSRIEVGARRAGPALLESFAETLEVSAEQLIVGFAGTDDTSVSEVRASAVVQVLIDAGLVEQLEEWLAQRDLRLTRLFESGCDLRRVEVNRPRRRTSSVLAPRTA